MLTAQTSADDGIGAELLEAPGFDTVTGFAARMFQTPVSTIAIIEYPKGVQRLAGMFGVMDPWSETREIPLSHSLCKHVQESDRPFIVNDARTHPVASDNKAIQELGIVAYLGVPIHDSDGVCIGSFGIADTRPRDWTAQNVVDLEHLAATVTDRMNLRRALQRSEELRQTAAADRSAAERLGRIVERSSHEVLVVDAETYQIVMGNAGARHNLGYSSEELRTMTPFNISPSLKRKVLDDIAHSLRSGQFKEIQFETTHRCKSGREYPVSVRLELDLDGERPCFIIYCKDISERLAFEEKLRERRRDVERLLGALPDCVTRAKPDTTLIYTNQSYADLIGKEPKDMLGEQFIDFVSPDEQTDVAARLASLTVENPIVHTEQHYVAVDGTVRMYLWSNLMLFEEDEPVEIVAVGRDVSLLYEARDEITARAKQAEAANSAKSVFLANMSHEIRTPLNGVLGMASALSVTPLSRDQQPMVDVIISAGKQLLSLLNNIIDLSKIEAEEEFGGETAFKPSVLVLDVIDLFRPQAEEKGLKLSGHISLDSGSAVIGCPERIKQVVTNLVSNAVKFTTKGEINVRYALEGDEIDQLLRIDVADTGPGVPDNLKELIFNRFQQGEHTVEQHLGGAGLGLAISKRICDLQGGSLVVEDGAKGKGAVFTARFAVTPTADLTEERAHSGAASEQSGAPNRLRLLIAEDNQINQKVLEALLIRAPVTLTFADNGQEALEALERDNFDAALIDIQMPVLGGFAVAKAIRKREAEEGKSPLPLIACTANVMQDQVDAYERGCFDRHLPKPVEPDMLMACIDWIAEQSIPQGRVPAKTRQRVA